MTQSERGKVLLGVSEETGVDNRQPVITSQENQCIFSTEVIHVVEQKGNQHKEVYARLE